MFSFSDFSDLVIFAVAAVLLGALALVNLRRPFARNQLRPVPALSATVLSFIATALASTVIYLLTGSIARVDDALYESFAGVSTNALSLFADPSTLTDGVLIWRAGTQWIGGLGALILAAGLLPFLGGSRELVGGPQGRSESLSGLGSRPSMVIRRAVRIYFSVTVAVAVAFIITGMGATRRSCSCVVDRLDGWVLNPSRVFRPL